MSKNSAQKKLCIHCGKEKHITKSFYASDNPLDKDGRISMCKDCIKENINYDDINSVKNVLHQINKPFIYDIWESALEETKNPKGINKDLFGCYMKTLALNYRGQGLTWKDSDETSSKNKQQSTNVAVNDIDNLNKITYSEYDLKNKEDVIKMVGYDPFEYELEPDKKNLYNKLVDFLDESTLEDSFKLPTVIEIVRSFHQIDKINAAITNIIANPRNIVDNSGGIKSLFDSKQKMLNAILALAKDNGISVNHNNNKSKGSGTLSGIMKQLQEKGFKEAEVNIFDIETEAGMRQVADISHKSILAQLQFDENDYTEMIREQKEMIYELTQKVESLEEENRILKIEIKSVIQNK